MGAARMAPGPLAAESDGMTRLAALAATMLAAGVAVAVSGAAPGGQPAPTLVLGACADVATGRCGVLSRPENPRARDGRRVGIRVLVLPALDRARRDPRTALFFLAGGPGAAGSELAGWAATAFPGYWQRHDLVFVDQRGTGRSNRLNCREAWPLDFSSPAAAVRGAWGACVRRLEADPRFYTTAVAMDDLDAVRAALGYHRIDLYGVSYGATAAQIYVLRHGSKVRSAILDGGTLLHVPVLERWAPNAQRVLDRLFARCRRDAGCRTAFPDPARDLEDVIAALRTSPVRVAGVTVTPAKMERLVQQLTVRPETAASVPLLLRLAAEGRWRDVARRSGQMEGGAGSYDTLMGHAIMCSEPWARMRRAEVERLGRDTYLLEYMREWWRYGNAVCSVVPKGVVPPGSDTTPRSRVPVLAIVGAEDPQDPLSNLAGLRSRLRNVRTVVVAGSGHGSAGVGCLPRVMNRFLERASAARIDVRCAGRNPSPPFVLR
jgi:pimeloyl-ACP methyl ester carboxylesterase